MFLHNLLYVFIDQVLCNCHLSLQENVILTNEITHSVMIEHYFPAGVKFIIIFHIILN